eukprot:gene10547-14169_t
MVHILGFLLISFGVAHVSAFQIHSKFINTRVATMLYDSIDFDTIHSTVLHIPHWIELAAQGIADSDIVSAPKPVCADFGQPGWAPFCFLNGNPVFNAFDQFQLFIQNSVLSLRSFLQGIGIENAYGPSIILFTILVRIVVFPLTYRQLSSSQMTTAVAPKVKEIKEKFPDNKELQTQMTALLYQEAQVNPLAGCLPAIVQIPVFIAMYRSFVNIAATQHITEPFLWLPNLEGPVYGARSTDWILSNWHDLVPSLGWHDTLCFLSIPVILMIAQSASLKILTPPSDDPAVQQSQKFLKYLPLMIGYFSLSVPAGLGVYWIVNNILSTVTTAGIKEYFKRSPPDFVKNIDIDKLANSKMGAYMNPAWGYSSKEQMIEEAKLNYRPSRSPKIPFDFV